MAKKNVMLEQMLFMLFILLTSRINKIVWELRGGWTEERNSLAADAIFMQESKDSDTERRRKLWEKAKEIGNPWDMGGTVHVSAVKGNCHLNFGIVIMHFGAGKCLSWQSLHLSEGKY